MNKRKKENLIGVRVNVIDDSYILSRSITPNKPKSMNTAGYKGKKSKKTKKK